LLLKDQFSGDEVLPTTWTGQVEVKQFLLTWGRREEFCPGVCPSQGRQPLQNKILVKHVAAFAIGQPAYSDGFFIPHQARGTENLDCSKLRHECTFFGMLLLLIIDILTHLSCAKELHARKKSLLLIFFL
jgi:hypothetical protein